jgi:hypothetical protein
MNNIALDIFRKRLLIDGFYSIEITEQTIKEYFSFITDELSLRTYGEPIVHATSGTGKDLNQGYDGFVPLIDSGIYIGVWANRKFLSLIIYACKDFDENIALQQTKAFFGFSEQAHKLF